MLSLLVFVIALLISIIATGLVRQYALRSNLLDIPNHRSSHVVATPRGGGLAIVSVFLGGALLLFLLGLVPIAQFLSVFAGGVLVAGVGFADDRTHVPAKWRSTVHFLAAITALSLLGGMPAIQFGSETVDLGIVGDVLAGVFIVWMINLFNFMDGIDGIAAVEVICVAVGALLITLPADGSVSGLLLNLLIAATSGFLVWNWPPAKIFMGDVGSGFLGFVLAVIALMTVGSGLLTIWPWLILAGVFLMDATITLFVRVASGQTWYEAHRSHAYQIWSRRLGSHAKVTVSVLLVNLVWLFPIALYAQKDPQQGWWLTLLAWLPIAILALKSGAGRVES